MLTLLITHVDTLGTLVKIVGQINLRKRDSIEEAIESHLSARSEVPKTLRIGELCLARYPLDGHFYRSSVVDHVGDGLITVRFIDYGNAEDIKMEDIRTMNNRFLQDEKPLAISYILASVWSPEWTENNLNAIRDHFINCTVEVDCLYKVRDYDFVTLRMDGIPDLAQYLIETMDVGQRIEFKSQRDILISFTDGLEQTQTGQGRTAFTATCLSINTEYEVLCSYVQDGPFLFCIQLSHELAELDRMMAKMNELTQLTQMQDTMSQGRPCLVRYRNRNNRALITSVGAATCTVSLVDYGNTVTVPQQQIFEIPARFLNRKIFSIRATISGHKQLDRTNNLIKERFMEMVTGRMEPIRVRVVPLEGSPSVHYCEFLGKDNVYDELFRLQVRPLELAEAEPIPSRYVGPVRITFIHTVKRFYVIFEDKLRLRSQLADELCQHCEEDARPMTEIRNGAICAAMWQGKWFRAEIRDIRTTTDHAVCVLVNLIDDGRDIEIPVGELKGLNYHFSKIPPIVFECSLYGLQADGDLTTIFRKAIELENKIYQIKIHNRITYNSYLIDLMSEDGTMIFNKELKLRSDNLLDTKFGKHSTQTAAMVEGTFSQSSALDTPVDSFPEHKWINVNVSNFVMTTEFYCQRSEDEKRYWDFMVSLQNQPLRPFMGPVYKGSFILFRYDKDGQIHRGQVYACNEKLKKYKVFLMDVGHKTIISTDEIYANDFPPTTVPLFARRCCLSSRDLVLANNSPDLEQQLLVLIKNAKSIECLVTERNEDLNYVEIKVDGVDLYSAYKALHSEIVQSGTVVTPTASTVVNMSEDNTVECIKNNSLLFDQIIRIHPIDSFAGDVFSFRIGTTGKELYMGRCDKINPATQKTVVVKVLRIENDILDLRPVNNMTIAPQQPFLSSSFSVTVCTGPTCALNRVHVQKIDALAQITKLLVDMNKFYEDPAQLSVRLPSSSSALQEGQLCAIQAADGFWVRGRILAMETQPPVIQARLIDYGRDETVGLAKVRLLDEKFKDLDVLATEVFLPIDKFSDKISDKVVANSIVALTKNMSVLLKVIENYRGRWIVELVSNGFTISEVLEEKKLAIRCGLTMIHKQIDKLENAVQPDTTVFCARPVDMLDEVTVSHFDSPERFFVQLHSDLPKLQQMQENLQIIASSLIPLTTIKVHEYCIVRNSFDYQWYRARILDSAPDMTSVQFVDYGNTDVITTDKGAKIKSMLEEFRTIPDFAKFCSLPMRPWANRSEWDDRAFDLFTRHLQNANQVTCKFLTETKLKKHYVRLFINDQDMEDVLSESHLGIPVNILPSNLVCYISHVNCLADFYIQFEQDATVLDLLNQYLKNADALLTVAEPEAGGIYAAQFRDDMEWYRVKVLKPRLKPGGPVEVCFLDFGNVDEVIDLKEINVEIKTVPHLARQCKLFQPKNVFNFSIEAEARFQEIAQMGATVMQVVLVQMDKDVAVVELLVVETGQNLLELLPLDKNPYKTDVDLH